MSITNGFWFVGRTLRDATLCVVGDGDSVVCEFPDRSYDAAISDAEAIARLPEMIARLQFLEVEINKLRRDWLRENEPSGADDGTDVVSPYDHLLYPRIIRGISNV